MDRQPYVYYLEWTNLGKKYLGCRYAKGCKPEDLWAPYKTSSKIVSKFIEEHGDPDIIQVLSLHSTMKEVKNEEDRLLRLYSAGTNTSFLNIKGDSFRDLDIEKVKYRKGLDNPIHKYLENNREVFSRKVSEGTKKGHANSEKYKKFQKSNLEKMISERNPGKNKTKQTLNRMSNSQKRRARFEKENGFVRYNPMKGRTHTNEFKSKISDVSKFIRSKEVYECDNCSRIIKTNANFLKHMTITHHMPYEEARLSLDIKIQSRDSHKS